MFSNTKSGLGSSFNGFGNASNNLNNNNNTATGKSATIDGSPFGLDLEVFKVSEMPESITASQGDTVSSSKPLSAAKPKKKSVSSVKSSRSYGLINGIRASSSRRLRPQTDFKKGIFSTDEYLSMDLTPDNSVDLTSKATFDFASHDTHHQVTTMFVASEQRQTVVPGLMTSRSNSDIKKLVIDPDVSAAKRRKLANGIKPIQRDPEPEPMLKAIHGEGKKRYLSFGIEQIKAVLLDSTKRPLANIKRNKQESSKTRKKSDDFDYSQPPKDYWCSPSIAFLEKMSLSQLSAVPDFVVGRKKYGQVAFSGTVDLVALATADSSRPIGRNLYDSLMLENVIIFKENKTVEVYPEASKKPPQGQGLNVESLVTIENIYPKVSRTDVYTDTHYSRLLQRLKRMSGMEFVNYTADNGSWTFKVKHFSIWGLIDDDDDDDDDDVEEKVESKAEVKAEEVNQETELNATEEKAAEEKAAVENAAKEKAAKEKAALEVKDRKRLKVQKRPAKPKSLKTNKTTAVHTQLPTSLPGGWSFAIVDQDEEQEMGNAVDEPETESDDEVQDSVMVDSDTQIPASSALSSETASPESQNLLGDVPAVEKSAPKDLQDMILDDLEESSDDERVYEPVDLEQQDFELLEVKPNVDMSNVDSLSWQEVFVDCGISEESVFNPKFQKAVLAKVPRPPHISFQEASQPFLDFNTLDNSLFASLNSRISNYAKAKSELKIKNKRFANFDATTAKLVTNIDCEGAQIKFSSLNYGGYKYLEKLFKEHFNVVSLKKRSNGLPKVVSDTIDFDFLLNSVTPEEPQKHKFWDLASRLFDQSRVMRTPGNEEINKVVKPEVKARLVEVSQLELIRDWLQEDVNNEITTLLQTTEPGEDGQFQKVFYHLCKGDIKAASDAAQGYGNFHLSVIISLLKSNDPLTKEGAINQLKYWEKTSSSTYISPWLIKIYKLLSGDFMDSKFDVEVWQGISWKSVLMLTVSYGDTNKNMGGLCQEFFRIYGSSLETNDTELVLLKVFSLIFSGSRMELVFKALATLNSGLDCQLKWYIYAVVIQPRLKDEQKWLGHGDILTLEYAEQLIACNHWTYAMFVYMSLNSDQLASKYLVDIINRHIADIVEFDGSAASTTGRLNYMISTYELPKKLLAQAVALKYHYNGEYLQEAYALSEAERWKDAHKIILTKVAPSAVIGDGELLEDLLTLVNSFPIEVKQQYPLEEWAKGLGVYKNYIILKNNEGSEEFMESILNNLVIHLPLAEIYNEETRIALGIISKFVVQKTWELKRKRFEMKKLMELPLGECEKQGLAAVRLSW